MPFLVNDVGLTVPSLGGKLAVALKVGCVSGVRVGVRH
jgi:hypothetical protein